jgi:nucleoid-associated protein YgaU
MAGSDKNTRGSNPGRSATESSQPISETESREVAGQLLTSLKSASSAANALSHEAKLGMAVITILFFAFCFLVYHKMDLHQRQLTQASIGSTAGTPDASAKPEEASALMSGNVTGATTDPLLERSLVASDNEVTTGEQEVPTFAQAESNIAGSNFDAPSAMEFSEPAESDANTLADQNNELVADNSFPAAVIENREPQDLLAGSTTPNDSFAAADETSITPGGSPESRLGGLNAFNSENSTPEFGALEPTENVPQPQDNEFPLSALEGTEDLPASQRQPSIDVAETSDGITLPEAASSEAASSDAASSDAAEISFDSADALSSIETSTTETELSETPMLEEPAADSEKEPVLIAMLDPQDSAATQNADDAYSDRVSSFAPLDDASESNPSATEDNTPAFSTTVEQEMTDRTLAQQSNGFGSRGFDAVTQPGGRTGRNTVRTAGGSGADGKFSLAAFNSQNAEAEPAPDDGTTYEYTVVKNGENYSKISKRVYGTTRYFSALAVFNQHRIAEPKHMRPGMVVLTPSKEVLEERYPQLFVDSKPKVVEPAAFLLLEDGSPAYRVGERETLSEISKRFLGRSSRWVEILRLNQSNVKDPNKLKPGTILALPEDAIEVNVVP